MTFFIYCWPPLILIHCSGATTTSEPRQRYLKLLRSQVQKVGMAQWPSTLTSESHFTAVWAFTNSHMCVFLSGPRYGCAKISKWLKFAVRIEAHNMGSLVQVWPCTWRGYSTGSNDWLLSVVLSDWQSCSPPILLH